MNTHKTLKTGGDPRGLPDYAALRDELAKLSHPARPDVDWGRIEHLSLALFQNNGLELQTLCWFTLARTRLAGMVGLNEGLALLDGLLTEQWGAMWPRPVHARMEILAGLSNRLQSLLRTTRLDYEQLPLIYQAEQHLNNIRDLLQRLELKNISQAGELCVFMRNAATQLEKQYASQSDAAVTFMTVPDSESEMSAEIESVATDSAAVLPASSDTIKEAKAAQHFIPLANQHIAAISRVKTRVNKSVPGPASVHQVPENMPVLSMSPTRWPWRAFATGMLTMLIAGVLTLWGWYKINPQPHIPVPISVDAHALTTLAELPPLWRQEYGFALAARAAPAESEKLNAQWQHYLYGNALSAEALSGWHQGMEGLQTLTRRLNALDERKGKYLTGSELKSMVFTITQSFSRAVPVEEQLYQLSQSESKTSGRAAQLAQVDMQFTQLLNRYALIKKQAEQ